MKALLLFFVALLLIGGGMKMAGMELPIIDYPLGGAIGGPTIEINPPGYDVTVP